jgi:ATP-binding cassette subfamily C protein
MKKSGFYEKFLSLEKGYDTQVLKYLREDGIDFSGGERQKIAITRALYKNGSILVMDEPTAALDAIAEYNLYHELAEISRGKTVIFVSHRLASTRFCDRIALIGNGGIIEIGTHDELIKLGGLYREMFDAQAQYYKEDGESDESA